MCVVQTFSGIFLHSSPPRNPNLQALDCAAAGIRPIARIFELLESHLLEMGDDSRCGSAAERHAFRKENTLQRGCMGKMIKKKPHRNLSVASPTAARHDAVIPQAKHVGKISVFKPAGNADRRIVLVIEKISPVVSPS